MWESRHVWLLSFLFCFGYNFIVIHLLLTMIVLSLWNWTNFVLIILSLSKFLCHSYPCSTLVVSRNSPHPMHHYNSPPKNQSCHVTTYRLQVAPPTFIFSSSIYYFWFTLNKDSKFFSTLDWGRLYWYLWRRIFIILCEIADFFFVLVNSFYIILKAFWKVFFLSVFFKPFFDLHHVDSYRKHWIYADTVFYDNHHSLFPFLLLRIYYLKYRTKEKYKIILFGKSTWIFLL